MCSALLCCRASGNKFSHLSFQQFGQQYLRPKKGAPVQTAAAEAAAPRASSPPASPYMPPQATPTTDAGSSERGAISTSGSGSGSGSHLLAAASVDWMATSTSGSGSGSGFDPVAASVDWVVAGKVTPVRNQEHCGEASDTDR